MSEAFSSQEQEAQRAYLKEMYRHTTMPAGAPDGALKTALTEEIQKTWRDNVIDGRVGDVSATEAVNPENFLVEQSDGTFTSIEQDGGLKTAQGFLSELGGRARVEENAGTMRGRIFSLLRGIGLGGLAATKMLALAGCFDGDAHAESGESDESVDNYLAQMAAGNVSGDFDIPSGQLVTVLSVPEDNLDTDHDGCFDQADCAPSDPNKHPGATEICGDGIDQDCSGGDKPCTEEDKDKDGYSGKTGDCNDDDPAVNPGATEKCDEIDNNCKDGVDEGLTFDADRDGYTSKNSCGGSKDDCDDGKGDVHPGATDVCGDGVNQDCVNGDEPCPTKEPTPTGSPEPTKEPTPTDSPEPTKEPTPTGSPEPTGSPVPSGSPTPSDHPIATPKPVEQSADSAKGGCGGCGEIPDTTGVTRSKLLAALALLGLPIAGVGILRRKKEQEPHI